MLGSRYRLDRELRRDRYARTVQGYDSWLNRQVVITATSPPSSSSGARDDAVAWMTSKPQHPNLLDLSDSGIERDIPFVVVPVPPAGTLADDLARGALPADRVGALSLDLVGGIATLHEAGVVHGRLEPRSVAVGADGVSRISPGPLAPVASAGPAIALGDADAYRSPDFDKAGRPDPRDDVWSIGAVLHAALTGEPPPAEGFEEADARGLLPLGRRRPDVPAPQLTLVHRALATDPARRFASAPDMLAALAATAAPDAAADLLAGGAPSGQREGARWRLAACLAVGVGMVVGFWPALHATSTRGRAPAAARPSPIGIAGAAAPVLGPTTPPSVTPPSVTPPIRPAATFPPRTATTDAPVAPAIAPADVSPPPSSAPPPTSTTGPPPSSAPPGGPQSGPGQRDLAPR